MKKILHISKYYYPYVGGTEQIARECVQALKDKCEQKIIAFNDSREDEKTYVDDVEVFKCGSFIKVASQSISKTYKEHLHKIIREYDPDIIVFHYPNPFVASLLLRELKGKKTKLVLYWHLDIIKQKFLKKIFISQNRKLIERADKIIATSPNYIEGSEWLSKVKNKCVVIPNCINVNRMKITNEIEKKSEEIKKENIGKTICLAVGRHTEYKGFEYLIKASKKLDSNYKIYITGEGELTDKLKKLSQDDKKIVLTGKINDDDLKALILACDIFCFSSITRNEAFGLALAEAMYYGKPAITFNIPGSGVNYVCINGENGIEVENKNVEAYSAAIKKLAKDADLRKKYGAEAKKRIENNFLSENYKNNILKFFENMFI